MADEGKFTQADLDKAVRDAIDKAIAPINEKLEAADAKNAGLLDDLKKAQREARAAKDITPEAHQAEVERADKAESDLAEHKKQLAALTKERDKAVKDKETVEVAARNFAQGEAIANAIAAGNIIPGAVEQYKAWVASQTVTEVVDGKWASRVGDVPVDKFIADHLASDAGKNFKAAAANGGGGAPGGTTAGQAAKTVTRAQFDAMSHPERSSFAKDGGKVVEAA